jgi:hypothetical protein
MKSRRWHEFFFKGYKKALNSRILLDLALVQLIHAKFLAHVCKDLKPALPYF